MRKLIAISLIFLAFVGYAVWEIVYTNGLYGTLDKQLETLKARVLDSGDNPATEENLLLMEEIEDRVVKSRNVVTMVGNHALSRMLDDKIVTLTSWLKLNNSEETLVAVNCALQLVRDLKDETHLNVSNIL